MGALIAVSILTLLYSFETLFALVVLMLYSCFVLIDFCCETLAAGMVGVLGLTLGTLFKLSSCARLASC